MTSATELGPTLGWRLTPHARRAATRRGFAVREVLLCAADPTTSFDMGHYGTGRALRRRGHVAVAVHLPTLTVITVLLNSDGPWVDSDCLRANGVLEQAFG